MIVKYYGTGHRARPEWKQPYINAAIITFNRLSVEELSEHLRLYEPGASVWLVPGTFDLEATMWNDGWDDREYLLDDLLIEADLMTELEETSFWEGYRDIPPEKELLFEDELDLVA